MKLTINLTTEEYEGLVKAQEVHAQHQTPELYAEAILKSACASYRTNLVEENIPSLKLKIQRLEQEKAALEAQINT